MVSTSFEVSGLEGEWRVYVGPTVSTTAVSVS